MDFFLELSKKHNIELSNQQKQGVMHLEGPCLMLAVPGGGKTTTLLCRTNYLIKVHHIDPKHILSLTFSKASAEDMNQRYNRYMSSKDQGKVKFSTIHSFAYGVVLSYGRYKQLTYTFIEGKTSVKWHKIQILRDLYNKMNGHFITEGELEQLLSSLSYVKNSMYSLSEIEKYPSGVKSFYTIYKAYEALKEEHLLMDYDDMLTRCLEILLENPNILKHYQNMYQYIQVDEAQDTSKVQHRIIEILSGEDANVFYVADDDQSIYGFRGAYPQFIMDIEKRYKNCKIYKMEENYRSTKAIVSVSNRFIKKNTLRYDKQIFTSNEEGSAIYMPDVSRGYQQYEQIIALLKASDNHKDFSVLYRNNDSALLLALRLREEQIPFYISDFKRKYFSHWLIRDLFQIMTFAKDTRSKKEFSSFYYKLDGFYISKDMIQILNNTNDEASVFDRMIHFGQLTGLQRNNITRLKQSFINLEKKKPYEAIKYIIDDLGYEAYMDKRSEGSLSLKSNLMNKCYVLEALAKDCLTMDELIVKIEDLENIIKNATNNKDNPVVTLSTIHAAKGLEWPNVIMIDLIEGVIPFEGAIKEGHIHLIEEERRLYYVAMTRAIKKLYMFGIKTEERSRFLNEVEKIVDPKRYQERKSHSNNQAKNTAESEYSVKTKAYEMGIPKSKRSHDAFAIGTLIVHKKYGDGIVLSCDDTDIEIDFGEEIKKMKLQFCMNKGLLRQKTAL